MGKRTYSNTAKRQTERFAKLFNRCPSLLEHIRRVECKANTLESKSGTFGLQKMEKILYFILNYDSDRFDIFLSRSYIKYEFVTKSAIFHITDFYNFSPKNITAFDETEHRMNQSLSTLSKKKHNLLEPKPTQTMTYVVRWGSFIIHRRANEFHSPSRRGMSH